MNKIAEKTRQSFHQCFKRSGLVGPQSSGVNVDMGAVDG
jgi:hypothetical protein